MGDWTVRLRWKRNQQSTGAHEELASSVCDDWGCHRVVEEHQHPEVDPEPLEFTVTLKYQRGDPPEFSSMISQQRGWTWKLAWHNSKGDLKMATGYGFDTREEAKYAAEQKAREIALEETPEEIYKYTPTELP